MPLIPAKLRKKCVACGGTGVNSKGDPCHPCLANSRYQYVEGDLKLVPNELGIVGSLNRSDRVVKAVEPEQVQPQFSQGDLYS